jgi:serine/threonine protein kinase
LDDEQVLELKKSYINLKELDHPSIIKYRALHIDQDQHCAFLVMDYIPYPSLADYQPKDEAELRHIVKELLSAIYYIHNQNICHRDIKPENILYNQESKTIKIIDFGISKKTFQRGSRRDMLTIIGTKFYLAPEIYIGGGYDERVDLWALGVTIYRLVTGYTPF